MSNALDQMIQSFIFQAHYQVSLPERLYRNIKMRGVHDAFALELNPDPVGFRPWKNDVELYLRAAVSDERMFVNHVDQVGTGHQHVSPSAEILLQSVSLLQTKQHLRF